FLRDEARGEREDRRLPAAESHRALKRETAALLAGQVLRRVAARDDRIARRIPDLLIDSVDDADESIAQRDEHAVESEAALLRTQLVRVGRTHRDDEIREHETALEQVHPSPPLELPMVVERGG